MRGRGARTPQPPAPGRRRLEDAYSSADARIDKAMGKKEPMMNRAVNDISEVP
jgi:hypothetical protein